MPITEKELIAGFLSKTLNIDATGVAALYNADGSELNADALDSLLTKHATWVKGIKPDVQKHFDEGYKKAQSEVAKKVEKKIADAIGIETDKIGDEFISEVETAFAAKATATPLTEDAVKQHPVFKTREKELLKQVKEANDKAIAEVEKVTKENQRKEILSKVRKKAIAETLSKKPLNISADAAKADKQLQLLVSNHLDGYDYEVSEDGEITGISKDGKRLEDPHGNPITFDGLLTTIYNNNGLEFQKVDPKQSPSGDGGTNPPLGGKKPLVVPKSEAEYVKEISRTDLTPAERSEVMSAWKSTNKAPASV